MALDPRLLEILACPVDRGPLLYFAADAALYNPRLKKKYRIDDGVPVMMVDEAVDVDDAEHQALMARARAEHLALTFTP